MTDASPHLEAGPWIQVLRQLPALKHLLIPTSYAPSVIVEVLSAVIRDEESRLETLQCNLADSDIFHALISLIQTNQMKSLKKLVNLHSSKSAQPVIEMPHLGPFRDLIAPKLQVLNLPYGLKSDYLQLLFSVTWPNLQSLAFTLPAKGTSAFPAHLWMNLSKMIFYHR